MKPETVIAWHRRGFRLYMALEESSPLWLSAGNDRSGPDRRPPDIVEPQRGRSGGFPKIVIAEKCLWNVTRIGAATTGCQNQKLGDELGRSDYFTRQWYCKSLTVAPNVMQRWVMLERLGHKARDRVGGDRVTLTLQ